MPKNLRLTRITVYALMLLVSAAWLAVAQTPPPAPGVAHVITIDGSINPGSADFIISSIEKAQEANAAALIIELDTPGGLVNSTQDIVKVMLEAQVPIIVYVTPPGAHAGSAGVMITLAGHLAVMAPSTRIGAASPVSMTGEMDETMRAKATNDIVGFVETIAKKRGRNVDWAKKAVTEAAVVTDDEAVKHNIVDFIAKDIDEILAKADGRKIILGHDQEHVVRLKGATTERREMGWKHKLIFYLADPNLVYLFMIIGMMGLYAEFSNPGMIVPGVVGGIALVLFAVSTQILPINAVGILLIVAGLVLFILEFKFTSFGLLTAGGIVLMVFGSLFMFENTPDKVFPETEFQLRASLGVILPSVIAMGLFTLFVAYKIVRAQVRKGRTGQEGIIGEFGTAATDIGQAGKVTVQGIYWDAGSDQPIAKGSRIRVVDAQGLMLLVEAIHANSSLETKES